MALQTLAARMTRSPLLVALLALGFTACTTKTPLHFDDAEDLRSVVAAGDTVRIETRDGHRLQTKVVEITEDSIIGTDTTVPLADVLTIEKIRLSAGRSTIAGLGTLTVLAALALLGLFIAVLVSCSNGSCLSQD